MVTTEGNCDQSISKIRHDFSVFYDLLEIKILNITHFKMAWGKRDEKEVSWSAWSLNIKFHKVGGIDPGSF
jgi:hypothetical protein